MHIGMIYLDREQYARSREYLQKALSAFEQSGERGMMAYTYALMARSYSLESQYKQAIEYGLKAAELYEKLGNKSESARLYLQLAQLCKRQKNYQKAAEYEEKARTLLGEGEKVIKKDK